MSIFNKLRQNAIQSTKTRKYIVYALGEITIIVIGIFIALSVNNWNDSRLKKIKEREYLVEIQNNLINDQISIQESLEFNATKTEAIFNSLQLFSKVEDVESFMQKFIPQMPKLASFSVFNPIRVAFENMLSAEKIDLIHNTELRKLLTEYYSSNIIDFGTQERVKEITRKFIDEISPLIVNWEQIHQLAGVRLQIKSVKAIDFYKNELIISRLFIMNKNIEAQNMELDYSNVQIEKIIQYIDVELSKK